MKEVFDKVSEALNKSLQDADFGIKVHFSDKRYSSFDFSRENFNEINKSDFNPDKKIAFLDGGNAEIISASNFSLSFIRIYYCIYKNNKRTASKTFEFFVLATSIKRNDEIYFEASVFGRDSFLVDPALLNFSSMDGTIRTGIHRALISKVGDSARRFAELNAAKLIADEKLADIIILDGTLQSSVTNESKYLENLYLAAKHNNVLVAALAKTSGLFTDTAFPPQVALQRICPFSKEWFYFPVVEINHSDHKADVYFLKLHEKSEYFFRFEVYKEQKHDMNEISALLVLNSSDPVFFGYPYGLIEADQFARVSNEEAASLKMQFIAKAGKDISLFLKTKDAHNVLDRIG